MTFRQLEYLVEVADQGSFSLAARKLMIAQPSLSQSIKSIETEFGITLFDRSAVPLVPTPAGEAFINKAHIILTAMADLRQEISFLETTPRQLRIGISDSAALINKHIFQAFSQAYPDVKLQLVERDQYQLERMLEAEKLDMIFTMIPYDNPNIRVIPLVEDEFLVALPREHPISQKHLRENPAMLEKDGKQRQYPQIRLSDCADVHFALSGKDRLKFAQLAALKTAFEPKLGFETDSLESLVAIAAFLPHGAMVPKLFCSLYDGAERPCFFRCAEKLPIWRFALSLPKNARVSAPAQEYIRLFTEYISELGLLSGNLSPERLIEEVRIEVYAKYGL